MLNLSLFDFDQDYFVIKVLLVVLIVFKLVSNRQTSQLTFRFNVHDRLMVDFLEQSKIQQLVYRPYWLTITPLLQSVVV